MCFFNKGDQVTKIVSDKFISTANNSCQKSPQIDTLSIKAIELKDNIYKTKALINQAMRLYRLHQEMSHSDIMYNFISCSIEHVLIELGITLIQQEEINEFLINNVDVSKKNNLTTTPLEIQNTILNLDSSKTKVLSDPETDLAISERCNDNTSTHLIGSLVDSQKNTTTSYINRGKNYINTTSETKTVSNKIMKFKFPIKTIDSTLKTLLPSKKSISAVPSIEERSHLVKKDLGPLVDENIISMNIYAMDYAIKNNFSVINPLNKKSFDGNSFKRVFMTTLSISEKPFYLLIAYIKLNNHLQNQLEEPYVQDEIIKTSISSFEPNDINIINNILRRNNTCLYDMAEKVNYMKDKYRLDLKKQMRATQLMTIIDVINKNTDNDERFTNNYTNEVPIEPTPEEEKILKILLKL